MRAHAVSPKGAIGLMQVMPKTCGALRARTISVSIRSSPMTIPGRLANLRKMYDCYDSPGFLAAYNAGPWRYEDHLTSRPQLPGETRAYLGKLTSDVDGVRAENALFIRSSPACTAQVGLFGARGDAMPVSDRSSMGVHALRARVVDLSALVPRSTGLFVQGTGEVGHDDPVARQSHCGAVRRGVGERAAWIRALDEGGQDKRAWPVARQAIGLAWLLTVPSVGRSAPAS
jgi:hypothetical protein